MNAEKTTCGEETAEESSMIFRSSRSAAERLLLDEGPVTIIVLLAALILWAFEIFANIRSGVQGWPAVLHLVVVGSLECFLAGYLVRALVRKARFRSGPPKTGPG